jgi:hypothetical protein
MWPFTNDPIQEANDKARAEKRQGDEQRQRELEAERAAAKASGEKMRRIMTDSTNESEGDVVENYRDGVAAEAANELDESTGQRCAEAMKAAKISPDAFNHDVKVMRSVFDYENQLADYDAKLADLVSKRDAAKTRLTEAEEELKLAKPAYVVAAQQAQQYERTLAYYEILKRKNLRLFGTPAEVLDRNALHYHCSQLGIPV